MQEDPIIESALNAFRVSQHNAGHFDRSTSFDPVTGYEDVFVPDSQKTAMRTTLEMVKALGAPEGSADTWRVLDVGCSIGCTSFAIAPLVREVVGIDLESEAIYAAHTWAEHAHASNITFAVVDAAIRLEESVTGPFDVILLKEVVEHLGSRERVASMIASLRNLLSPSGVIVLETPNYLFPVEPHLQMLIPPLAPLWLVRIIAHITKKTGSSDTSFFATLLIQSPYAIARIARDQGLNVIDAGARFSLPLLMDGSKTAQGKLKHIAPLIKLLGAQPIRPAIMWIAAVTHLYPTVTYMLSRKAV